MTNGNKNKIKKKKKKEEERKGKEGGKEKVESIVRRKCTKYDYELKDLSRLIY